MAQWTTMAFFVITPSQALRLLPEGSQMLWVQIPHLLLCSCDPWASVLILLCLSFLICKVEMAIGLAHWDVMRIKGANNICDEFLSAPGIYYIQYMLAVITYYYNHY